MIEYILEAIVFFWLAALTIIVIELNHCQKNQEELIWQIGDDWHTFKRENDWRNGHFFCKNIDSDFDCPKRRDK